MHAVRWHHRTPTAPTSVDFFNIWEALDSHQRSATVSDNGSSATTTTSTSTVSVPDSDTLFKTRSYTYSPNWSQLSSNACAIAEMFPVKQMKEKTQRIRDELAGNSQTVKCFDCCVKFYSEAVCVCMCVCDVLWGFSSTAGHEPFSFKLFKASVMYSGVAFISCPWRRLSTVHFLFTFVHNTRHNTFQK